MTALQAPLFPKWYEVARTWLGTKEVVGKGSNPRIMQMAARIGGWVKSFFKDDDIPWCTLFVSNCLIEAGYRSAGQTLAALDYAKWGQTVSAHTPIPLGAVVVFKRPGGGHVGFFSGQSADGKLIYVLGGNQSNAVTETWIEASRMVAVRWPSEDELPEMRPPVLLARNGVSISTNEA